MDNAAKVPQSSIGVILAAPWHSQEAKEAKRLAHALAERGDYPVQVGYCGQDGFGVQNHASSLRDSILEAIRQGMRRIFVVPIVAQGRPIGMQQEVQNLVSALQDQHPDTELIYVDLGGEQCPKSGAGQLRHGRFGRGWSFHRPRSWARMMKGRGWDDAQLADCIADRLERYGPDLGQDPNRIIRLSALKADQVCTLYHLAGGRHMASRLATLGFTPGAELTMVQNYGWGPVIVQLRDTRIALGRREAYTILVIPEAETHDAS
jgi:ferrous iron transport protein A